MTKIKDIESKLDTILAENNQAIQECENNINQSEQAIKQADSDLANAEGSVNVEDYNNAKNKIWSASHAKELYQKQKDKLTNQPLITKAEYDQLLSEITQIANAENERLNSEAITLLDNLKIIADKSSKLSQSTNNLLHTLQYKIYKDADRTILDNGNEVTNAKEYVNWQNVLNFYQHTIKNSFLIDGTDNRQKGHLTTTASVIWKG